MAFITGFFGRQGPPFGTANLVIAWLFPLGQFRRAGETLTRRMRADHLKNRVAIPLRSTTMRRAIRQKYPKNAQTLRDTTLQLEYATVAKPHYGHNEQNHFVQLGKKHPELTQNRLEFICQMRRRNSTFLARKRKNKKLDQHARTSPNWSDLTSWRGYSSGPVGRDPPQLLSRSPIWRVQHMPRLAQHGVSI